MSWFAPQAAPQGAQVDRAEPIRRWRAAGPRYAARAAEGAIGDAAGAGAVGRCRRRRRRRAASGRRRADHRTRPISTVPLPQTGWQSLSLLAWQAGGQQPSPLRQAVLQAGVHALGRCRRRRFPAGMRQLAAHRRATGGAVVAVALSSQAASVTPLPQRHWQSPSLTLVQPDGQQPSPEVQVVITVSSTHSALHWAALALRACARWQPMAGQLVGQSPSHFSLALARRRCRSGRCSRCRWCCCRPRGQQPSPLAQAVCMPSSTQRAVHGGGSSLELASPAALPGAGGRAARGGSQVLAASTAPLPQRALQSLSLVALQPEGQQPSPVDTGVCSAVVHALGLAGAAVDQAAQLAAHGRAGLRAARQRIAGLAAGGLDLAVAAGALAFAVARGGAAGRAAAVAGPHSRSACRRPRSGRCRSRPMPSSFCRVQPIGRACRSGSSTAGRRSRRSRRRRCRSGPGSRCRWWRCSRRGSSRRRYAIGLRDRRPHTRPDRCRG